MEVNASLINFAAGQLSKKFMGRIDLPNFYKAGMLVCRNFVPQVQGPAEFRAGSRYVVHTRLNQIAYQYPFVFNDDQAYALSFTDKKLRFLSDGSVILASSGEAQTVLLLHCDGANAGVIFTDSSGGKTITPAGDAQTATAQKVFGTASALLDGTGDYLSIPAGPDLWLDDGDSSKNSWTIDFRVRFISYTQSDTIYSQQTDASNYVRLFIGTNGPIQLTVNGTNKETGALSWNEDQWYHVAVTNDSGVLRFFRDGVLLKTTTAVDMGNYTGAARIGSDVTGVRDNLNGYIDEFRIVKGEAAFTTDFTPAAAAYSTSGSSVITGISVAATGVVTSAGHGYAGGEEVYISGVEGMTEINNKYYLVVYIDVDTFSLTDIDGTAINTTTYTAYTTGGVVDQIYEIDTPYIEADLNSLQFAQKADLMYIVHPNYEPRKLIRSGEASWALSTYTRTDDPFTKTVSGITQADPGVVTATAHGFSNGDTIELWGVVGMTDVNGNQYMVASKADNTFELTDPVTGADIDTSGFDAYSSAGVVFKAGDMPGAAAFYGGRLFFGGTDSEPESFWGSKAPTNAGVVQYDVFTVGTSADDGVTFPISSQNNVADRIQWFAGVNKFLSIGTYGGVYKANGGANNAPISGTAINVDIVDYVGSMYLPPARIGSSLFYVQRGALILNSFSFSIYADDFKAESLNVFSDEITKTGLTKLAVQQGTADIIWATTTEGKLIGMTVKVGEEINAWHSHDIGGADVKVISVCGEPQPDNRDDLWLVVERTIDGNTRRFIEYIPADVILPEPEDYFTGVEATDDAQYRKLLYEKAKELVRLDSALTLDTSQVAILTPGSAAVGTGVSFTSDNAVFSATDVGRYIKRKFVDGTESGIAIITAFVSTTVVTCSITTAFDSATAIPSEEWYLTATTVTGLGHLEGETVRAQIDGADDGTDYTVSGGAITLSGAATVVHVGLQYTGLLRTMPLDIGALAGTAQGRITTVNRLGLLFRHTRGAQYGTDPYRMETLKSRDLGAVDGRPSKLVTDVDFLNLPDGYDRRKSIYIIQDTADPCTIQGIVPFVDTTNE